MLRSSEAASELRCFRDEDFRVAIVTAGDVPDLPRDTVDPRSHGSREMAVVRAFGGLDDPAVSDGIVFGEEADGVFRHPDTLLRSGVEAPWS